MDLLHRNAIKLVLNVYSNQTLILIREERGVKQNGWESQAAAGIAKTLILLQIRVKHNRCSLICIFASCGTAYVPAVARAIDNRWNCLCFWPSHVIVVWQNEKGVACHSPIYFRFRAEFPKHLRYARQRSLLIFQSFQREHSVTLFHSSAARESLEGATSIYPKLS